MDWLDDALCGCADEIRKSADVLEQVKREDGVTKPTHIMGCFNKLSKIKVELMDIWNAIEEIDELEYEGEG